MYSQHSTWEPSTPLSNSLMLISARQQLKTNQYITTWDVYGFNSEGERFLRTKCRPKFFSIDLLRTVNWTKELLFSTRNKRLHYKISRQHKNSNLSHIFCFLVDIYINNYANKRIYSSIYISDSKRHFRKHPKDTQDITLNLPSLFAPCQSNSKPRTLLEVR